MQSKTISQTVSVFFQAMLWAVPDFVGSVTIRLVPLSVIKPYVDMDDLSWGGRVTPWYLRTIQTEKVLNGDDASACLTAFIWQCCPTVSFESV